MLNLDNLSNKDTLSNLLKDSLRPLRIRELIILMIFNSFNKRPFLI